VQEAWVASVEWEDLVPWEVNQVPSKCQVKLEVSNNPLLVLLEHKPSLNLIHSQLSELLDMEVWEAWEALAWILTWCSKWWAELAVQVVQVALECQLTLDLLEKNMLHNYNKSKIWDSMMKKLFYKC
jgi:hypothetical protein